MPLTCGQAPLLSLHIDRARRLQNGPFERRPTVKKMLHSQAGLCWRRCSRVRQLSNPKPQDFYQGMNLSQRRANNACLSYLYSVALAQNVHVATSWCALLLLFAAFFCKRLRLPAAAQLCTLSPLTASCFLLSFAAACVSAPQPAAYRCCPLVPAVYQCHSPLRRLPPLEILPPLPLLKLYCDCDCDCCYDCDCWGRTDVRLLCFCQAPQIS